MVETDNRLTPVAWQEFGKDKWCLTGQFGRRPIFLACKGQLQLNTDGLLVPFTPDHPHAQRIVRAWNVYDNQLLFVVLRKDYPSYFAMFNDHGPCWTSARSEAQEIPASALQGIIMRLFEKGTAQMTVEPLLK